MDSALPPLTLYVHFPWCLHKCPYCDFNSHALRSTLPEADYIDALLRDLEEEAPAAQGRELQSVFLGGGTPSLFSPEALARLLEGSGRLLRLAADAEITLEANPGTLERGRFAEYRSAGITRVSLGAQSFSDAQLRSLGRIHNAADTCRAVEELHAVGLINFNLDLMVGLPGQSLVQACADVQAALALSPAHLSHYQLTLEPGTLFGARAPPGLPDPDSSADMQAACQDLLGQAGFVQYEVSAYAREGARCRHNLNYWRFGDYLGIGAGAHGKSTRRVQQWLVIERSAKWREPRRYLHAQRAALRQPVPAADLPFEYLMNALRLNDGFEEREFQQRTGVAFEPVGEALYRLKGRGMMEQTAGGWRASARGFAFLNDLLSEFLPAAPQSV